MQLPGAWAPQPPRDIFGRLGRGGFGTPPQLICNPLDVRLSLPTNTRAAVQKCEYRHCTCSLSREARTPWVARLHLSIGKRDWHLWEPGAHLRTSQARSEGFEM